MASFDIDGARKAGYSDADIVQHVAGPANFDVEGARKAGYGDHEIISHLMGGVPNPVQANPTKYTPPALQSTPLSGVQKFASEHPYATAAATTLAPPLGAILDPNAEGMRGTIKGLGRDAYDLATGPAAGPIGMGLGYAGKKLGITSKVEAATEPSNEMQRGGRLVATIGEAALPIPKALNALPNTARAGRNFEAVMQAAKDVPVDVSKFAEPVLRAKKLNAVAGDPMAPVLRKALGNIGPTTNPLTYGDSRILASSAGRKAQQTAMGGTLTGEMGKRLGEAATGLDAANAEAAAKAGVGDQYLSAMREYRNAKRLEKVGDVAKKVAVTGALGGGLYEGGKYAIRKALGQ